ncbi:MAG: hypothetical protein GX144_09780 [Clostridiaceae bacterium]|nr:hypothetical protein [Clostridiaceae bacterium]
MKQFITPEQLLMLNNAQKVNLLDMWLPQVNTLAMARVCTDVINDEYDNIVFVIGEVLVTEGHGNLVLRRYKLLDESSFEENDELSENKEEFEPEYIEPGQYFSKEDCLPVFSIGQLIELLNRVRYGQDGFQISIPPIRRMIGDKGFTVINSNELEYEEEELCDILWNALVECL